MSDGNRSPSGYLVATSPGLGALNVSVTTGAGTSAASRDSEYVYL